MGTAAAVQPRPQLKFAPRPAAKARKRIAFVCVGNSCRSQMAEAWARHLVGDKVEVMSAGISPLGFITEETIEVMQEKNISLEGQTSKGLEAIDWQRVDVLVNMTLLPGRSVVPSFAGQRLHWNVRDPYGEPIRVYRRVRDQLERKVKQLLAELEASSTGGPATPPVS